MRVSQRLDYTLRGLVELARAPAGSMLTAGEIADRLSIPRRFLEQQLTAMAKRGIVHCRRGAGGGCALSRPPGSITVAEVVRAAQGQIIDVPQTTSSATARLWSEIASGAERALESTTLADLAARQSELDRDASAMYYI